MLVFHSYIRLHVKTMKPLLLALLLLSPFLCHANSYDDDEQLRRDAQRLVDMDKRERAAAKKRADRVERGLPAYPTHADSGGSSGNIVAGILGAVCLFGGVGFWLFRDFFSNDKNREILNRIEEQNRQIARQSVRPITHRSTNPKIPLPFSPSIHEGFFCGNESQPIKDNGTIGGEDAGTPLTGKAFVEGCVAFHKSRLGYAEDYQTNKDNNTMVGNTDTRKDTAIYNYKCPKCKTKSTYQPSKDRKKKPYHICPICAYLFSDAERSLCHQA